METNSELARMSVAVPHKVAAQDDVETVGEVDEVCATVVLKCSYVARIGQSDILWTVNILSTTWNRASDERYARLIRYTMCTVNHGPYCHGGNTASDWKSGPLQDADFGGTLSDSRSTSGGTFCSFADETFVRISWAHKAVVSHRSTEAEIIFLDTVLSMEGLLVLIQGYGY